MTDLWPNVLKRTHRYLKKHNFFADSDTVLEIAEQAHKAILRGELSSQHLTSRLRLGNFLRRNRVRKSLFSDQLVAELKPCLQLRTQYVREGLHEFFVDLKNYLRRHVAKDIYGNGSPRERPGTKSVRDALFGFCRTYHFVYEEVPSGKGRIDVLLAGTGLEIVVETKLSSNFKGTQQLEEYLKDAPSRRVGYFIIFDTTPQNNFLNLCDIENRRYERKKTLYTIVVHVNLPVPSRTKRVSQARKRHKRSLR